MLYLKIAIKESLFKRPVRTIFTIISIVLGVAIFFAVNISSDSLSYSLEEQLDPAAFGDIEIWLMLFRGIVEIFSAISLIVLVIIVKNLMEMAKEEKIHEIGILRAIGMSRSAIFKIFFYQILLISIIGTTLGMILGVFISQLFFGPFSDVISAFTYSTTLDILFYISPLSILISILAGLFIPTIFGMIPAISASRTNIVEALYPRMRTKNELFLSLGKFIAYSIISIILIIMGIVILNMGFVGLISFDDITIANYISIILLFVGGLSFIFGVIILSANFIPHLSVGFSYLFYPLLTKLRNITAKSLQRNARRTKNTFSMVAIALATLITITIVIYSMQAGVGPGARMRLGGDIRLGLYYQWDHRVIPLNTTLNLSRIDGVKSICEVKNSRPTSGYSMCDGFGENTEERFLLFVINTTTYASMHSHNSIYKFQGDDSVSLANFIDLLNENGTILLQDRLSNHIMKNKGDDVNITMVDSSFFPGFSTNFSVVGIFNILPGLRYTWDEMPEDNIYYYGMISWNSFFNVTGLNYTTSTGYFWLELDDPNQSNRVFNDIKTLYTAMGSPWSDLDLDGNSWAYRTYTEEVNKIQEVINLILLIFTNILQISIAIALFGLSITIIMNVNQRKKEIGILRSLGMSKSQIVRMIFGETLIIGMLAIIIGLITGGFASYLMVWDIPFMPYVPIFFVIPWNQLIFLSVIVFIATIISSIVPSMKANKLNIVDAIRVR
ncbi:MAG: ABC transporter permease [Candidatus Helarchaeota archaeon]